LGFGFVEYHDAESAASARRNLNNYEVNGRRLRVDMPSQSSNKPGAASSAASGAAKSAAPPDLKRPRTEGAGGEQVAGVIASMNPAQLYQIVQQTKAMVDAAPERAKGFLVANPQMTYAVLQAQVLLGMAPQLVQAARQRRHLQQQQVQQMQAEQMQQMQQMQLSRSAYSEESLAQAFGGLDEEQRALLINVLSMPEHVLETLTPEQRLEAVSLRQKALDMIAQVQRGQQ
jgi:cleavage stimulation factor subunit 2